MCWLPFREELSISSEVFRDARVLFLPHNLTQVYIYLESHLAD